MATQSIMDLQIDSADMNLYVKVPTLRSGRWTRVTMTTVIRVAAHRAKYRMENGGRDE